MNKAAEQSDQAKQDTAKGVPEKAAEDRKATKQALEEAKKQLGEALEQLAAEASKEMASEAKESGDLAGEAKPLDAVATKDLDAAQRRPSRRRAIPRSRPAICRPPKTRCAKTLPRPRSGWPPASNRSPPRWPKLMPKPKANRCRGKSPDRSPEEKPGQMSVTSQPSSQGATKMGPDGLASPDNKSPEGPDLRKEPWFAKLPPDARNSMRSNAQRRPPPGYERRTQEYFENLDR